MATKGDILVQPQVDCHARSCYNASIQLSELPRLPSPWSPPDESPLKKIWTSSPNGTKSNGVNARDTPLNEPNATPFSSPGPGNSYFVPYFHEASAITALDLMDFAVYLHDSNRSTSRWSLDSESRHSMPVVKARMPTLTYDPSVRDVFTLDQPNISAVPDQPSEWYCPSAYLGSPSGMLMPPGNPDLRSPSILQRSHNFQHQADSPLVARTVSTDGEGFLDLRALASHDSFVSRRIDSPASDVTARFPPFVTDLGGRNSEALEDIISLLDKYILPSSEAIDAECDTDHQIVGAEAV
ncbi:hypothetical protein BJ138DRAFT_1141304 [Hygrophoropsis aurantiaca]|uniref:Uncharacterized protein n=1 Tax=Hygrophoropsis aurantiaca TaxID=72124 RepID=A0ACB8ARH0_9AGAM|nr:hypothetical protein BJ138DRAFT_1141304 [Hygrophoropsis aurantiaca]